VIVAAGDYLQLMSPFPVGVSPPLRHDVKYGSIVGMAV